jgi:hypothetical protein
MKAIVREQFNAELQGAKKAVAEQDFETAWIALQRAHILGQTDAIAHFTAHWQMLKLAWRQRDLREVAGQLLPTLVAIPLTLLYGQVRALRGGKVNVDPSESMSIPDDLQRLLEQ